MINYCLPVISGNGAKVYLTPPASAISWRLARNNTGAFTDENGADVIYDGDGKVYTDIAGLNNGATYHYKVFYFDGAAWDASYPSATVVPGLFFNDISVDPQTLVRSRLDSGLNAMIADGVLKHPKATISVLSSNPQVDRVDMPVVTVHLRSDAPETRFIGDFIGGETDSMTEGWQSSVAIEVVAWSNVGGDERKALRKAIKAVLIANSDIFNGAGVQQTQISVTDEEDFESYGCAMYLSRISLQFVCLSGVTPTITYPTLDIRVSPL